MKKIWEKYRWFILAGFGFLAILLLVLFNLFKEPEEYAEVTTFSSSEQKTIESTAKVNTDWYVDVKGAVKAPGMYKVKEGTRLMDAVDQAGGFLEEADRNQVNFSKLLTDQEVIFIPKIGETPPTIQAGETIISGDSSSDETGKVNINTADSTELQTLSGIGEKKAQDILNYREENGSFQKLEDLLNVSGIGEKTLENLRDFITIN
ncbi:helix-hairpin-helix domain-containing protein [Enterococcus sp. AZ103]|uniref:helix-hairpin-helix domain-containing protein n=1 Tax=Enterococcus sp. AZ103 TaxID=2774628 RepID=UPI003F2491B6